MNKNVFILVIMLCTLAPLATICQTDKASEETAIKKVALDYIEGAFTGDGDRMAKAVHPELNKVLPMTLPQTGTTVLNKSGASYLIEATRAKLILLDKEKWNIEVTILAVEQDIASVKVVSSMFYDLVQMAKIDREWKIINVLWKMNQKAAKK